MTKIEIIRQIGENVSLANNDIEKIIDEFVRIAQNTLKTVQKVSLTGLGAFTPKVKAARIARNPKTGEKVEVAAKKVVKFKPGKELLEILKAAIPPK